MEVSQTTLRERHKTQNCGQLITLDIRILIDVDEKKIRLIFSVCCFSLNKIRTVNYLVVCIDDTFSYYTLHDLVKYLDIHQVILVETKTFQSFWWECPLARITTY